MYFKSVELEVRKANWLQKFFGTDAAIELYGSISEMRKRFNEVLNDPFIARWWQQLEQLSQTVEIPPSAFVGYVDTMVHVAEERQAGESLPFDPKGRIGRLFVLDRNLDRLVTLTDRFAADLGEVLPEGYDLVGRLLRAVADDPSFSL